jgi:glycosyltransferase involved in cell wall biosynthesis
LVGEDPRALANAALRVLSNFGEARSMAERARRLVEERFSWAASADALERVWQEAVGRG